MLNVLYIGTVNDKGNFSDYRWTALYKWISKSCNNVRIYAGLSIDQIKGHFSQYSNISEENFPDPDSSLKGYRLFCKSERLWFEIANLSYKIDSGITHIYFLSYDLYKAELEVNDCENFVILHLSKDEERDLLKIMPSMTENIEQCNYWKEQIDHLLEGDLWKPLGQANYGQQRCQKSVLKI